MDHKGNLNIKLIFLSSSISILLVIAFWGLYLKTTNLSAQIDRLSQSVGYSIPESLQIGTIAPDFVLLSTQSEEISLDDFQGQKTLFVFYSPTCTVCQKVLPSIKEISSKIPAVLVSYGTPEENQQFVISENIGFIVLNWEQSVADKYKVTATPAFFLINEDLKIENSGFVDNLTALEEFCKLSQE